MQDRLAELRGARPDAVVRQEDVELGIGANANGAKGKQAAPLTQQEGAPHGEFMGDFFQEVGQIKSAMSVMRRNIKSIEEKYVQQLNAINIDVGAKTGNELDDLMAQTNQLVQEVRAKLDNLKKNNEQYKTAKGSTPTELRIRTNMHGTLTQKFLELVQEYQEVQTNYKNKYKEKMERQYKIAKPDASQVEIDQALESGDSSQVFANQILDPHLHQQAKNALAYVQDKHRDIIRLEASIKELHQLFLDMAVLVDSQGELLNQIEFNVNQSVAYTNDGVQQLNQAAKLQKKSRKKMYIIICILFIVLIVIIAPIISTQLKK